MSALDAVTDDTDAPQSALVSLQAPPVSAEGRAWGESYLKQHPEGVDTKGEAALLQDFDANAQEARNTLKQARERLAAQRMDPSVLGLRFAQAMLSPSAHGIPDQWGKAAGAVADWRQQNQQFQQQQGEEDTGLAEKLSGVDRDSLKARLALQELQERTQGSMLNTAIRATAKPAGHQGAESPIGKMVEDRYGAGSLQTTQGQAAFDAFAAQQEADKHKGDFTPQHGSLLAALATAGVSLPAGLRSKQQQTATLQGLLDANPGASPTDIAELVRTGQLDFNGAKRSTGQLATIAAATNAQSLQLEKNFASLDPLVSKVDVSGIPIINRAMAQLRQNWKSGGDKDTAAYMGYLRAVAGEYAKIKSGSTGAAAAAEGEMKDAMEFMSNAFSQGGYDGIKEALTTEAANKRDSYAEGLHTAAQRHSVTGAGASAAPSKKAVSLDDYLKSQGY